MAVETKVASPAHDGAVANQDYGNNENHNSDIEKAPSYNNGSDPNKPDMEPQIGVGGRGHTQRRLKNHHVTLIGFCSGIGTGLFIGTGSAYAKAGPAGLLLAYIVVGSVLWCVMQSIAELATVVSCKPLSYHFLFGDLSPDTSVYHL